MKQLALGIIWPSRCWYQMPYMSSTVAVASICGVLIIHKRGLAATRYHMRKQPLVWTYSQLCLHVFFSLRTVSKSRPVSGNRILAQNAYTLCIREL